MCGFWYTENDPLSYRLVFGVLKIVYLISSCFSVFRSTDVRLLVSKSLLLLSTILLLAILRITFENEFNLLMALCLNKKHMKYIRFH